MKKKKRFNILGLMSGTSLDGLDIAHCSFYLDSENSISDWKINQAETFSYSSEMKEQLKIASSFNALQLIDFSNYFGKHTGSLAKEFLNKNKLEAHFIASHGHTIFHQPKKKITCQIGSGASIAAASGITTICDFRSLDVALGGQGAPLVPIGDRILFSEYDYCLNLGGFANISFEDKKKRIAFDICPVNIIINLLANNLGLDFDKDGHFAEKGKLNKKLLSQLNSLDFYSAKFPKSLGREWLEDIFLPHVLQSDISVEDKLRTIYEHIACQISKTMRSDTAKKVLITGGGAHNKYLIQLLKKKTKVKIIIPDSQIVDFKEALIFALLGLLRYLGINNCLSSVTGAEKDNCGGIVYFV